MATTPTAPQPGRLRQTLEQQRAADAWACSKGISKEYVALAKGLPALIMNSGLMQVMAFLHQKGGLHEQLAQQLRLWLSRRGIGGVKAAGFEPFMEALMNAPSPTYQAITAESLAWLRWLRQMAAARHGED